MDDNKKPFFRLKKLDKNYFDLTPEQKYEMVRQMLSSFSPNEEVRKRADGQA